MKRYLNFIIKNARAEKKLSQKKLVDIIGEHKISVRTLRRIEQGYLNVSYDLVLELLNYFNLDLRYTIKNEYEDKMVRDTLQHWDEYTNLRECLCEINHKIELHRMLFNESGHYYKDFHVKTLIDFILYYPLVDQNILDDVIYRIGGACTEPYYLYLLDQMERLYESIPEDCNDLKRIAKTLSIQANNKEVLLNIQDLKQYRDFLEQRSKRDGKR